VHLQKKRAECSEKNHKIQIMFCEVCCCYNHLSFLYWCIALHFFRIFVLLLFFASAHNHLFLFLELVFRCRSTETLKLSICTLAFHILMYICQRWQNDSLLVCTYRDTLYIQIIFFFEKTQKAFAFHFIG
jgi:hypothetical protein